MGYLTREQINSVAGLSSRQAAKALGVKSKSTVNKYREIYSSLPQIADGPKILVLDIESKPLTVYSWGLWDTRIGIDQIVEHGGMFCVAYSWVGEDEIHFLSDYHDGHQEMLSELHAALSEADVVVGYNSARYDMKRINNEFLKAGMTPPKPYKQIDLIKANRNKFDLPSRKLDYLAQQTNVGEKVKHEGFSLWVDCMNGDAEAWDKMREYNIHDVKITKDAYLRILPWLDGAAHMGMFRRDGNACPYCAHTDTLVEKGSAYTYVQEYQAFQCSNCGGWSRGNTKQGVVLHTKAI